VHFDCGDRHIAPVADRPRILGREPVPPLSGPLGPERWGRLPLTTKLNNSPLGSATITHPFNPYRGERLEVLKTRCVSGVETLILRHSERGSFAVPREWTDWGEPASNNTTSAPLFVDFPSLLKLAHLLEGLADNIKEG
jgi:hypothetical protein